MHPEDSLLFTEMGVDSTISSSAATTPYIAVVGSLETLWTSHERQ